MNAHMMFWIVAAVLGASGAAWAQGAGAAPEAAGLLAAGVGGGLWQGALVGVARALLGFFGKHKGTAFRGQHLIPAALAGAVAGLAMGLLGMRFDRAEGWLAAAGATEVVDRLVKGLWRRWAGDHIGEAVARTVARNFPPREP